MQVITEDPEADIGPITFERSQEQNMAQCAADATRAAIPQGGGTGAAAAQAAANDIEAMRNLRVTPCVPVGSAPPVFIPRAKRDGKAGTDSGQDRQHSHRSLLAEGKRGGRKNAQQPKGGWADRPRRENRMQGGTVEDVFDQFAEDVETMVLFSDTLQAEQAAEHAIAAAENDRL
jgi:hypothetical protein